MPLLARCRHCRHEFPIAPRFRGQEVECIACGERFPFSDGPEVPDSGEEYVVEVAAEQDVEPAIDVELMPVEPRRRRLRQAARIFCFCILPALLVGGGAVYVWHRMQPRSADSNEVAAEDGDWPVVDALPGFEPKVVLTLHVTGANTEFTHDTVVDGAGTLIDAGGNHATRARGSGGRMTILVAPVSDPQAAAKKIKFGVVESVRGRTITVRANPAPSLGPGTDALDQALFNLQSPNWMRQEEALAKLKTLPVDHRRKAVAKALEQALANPNHGFPADIILEVLGVWGTEESVPAIETFLKTLEGDFSYRTALMTLAKIKGKRALEIIMGSFDRGNGIGVHHGQSEATPAIIAFGPGAEDAILERFRPDDPGRHLVIVQILKEIGTEKCIPFLEAAVDKNLLLDPHARAAAQSIKGRKK
ncbi:MAG TPA: hypothetical protein VHR66_04515 [Gemmataceae bacterium]|jgi:hypothetical protein|nr:hypothetical protein [Gemmataceae bacterium]